MLSLPPRAGSPDGARHGIQITRGDFTWADGIPAPAPTVVSFGFRANPPPTNYDGGLRPPVTLDVVRNSFTRFSATQINATLAVLQLFQEVANISFTRVGTGTTGDQAYSDNATMLLANFATPTGSTAFATAFAYTPSPS